MSAYTPTVMGYVQQFQQNERLKNEIDRLIEEIGEMNERYATMLEASQLLTTVSDDNTRAVLDYVTGVVNKTLAELFPHDTRRVYIQNSMYQGKHAHINIKLIGSNGKTRDMTTQTGTGVRQTISYLYLLALVEIRKGRRLIVADELLNGLHPVAKRIVSDVISIFAEEGFQFAMVEYGIDDLGKIYLVEKPGPVATVTPLGGNYNNEVFIFNRPPEEVDLSIQVDEADDD